MLLRLMGLVVLLVSLRVSGLAATPTTEFPKPSFVGATVSELVPVPLKGTDCVPVGALSVKVRAPERLPRAVGRNDTLILQLFWGAREPGHLFTAAKSPVVATFVMSNAAVPVFVTVTGFGALALPTGVLGKVREEGEKLTFWATPTTANIGEKRAAKNTRQTKDGRITAPHGGGQSLMCDPSYPHILQVYNGTSCAQEKASLTLLFYWIRFLTRKGFWPRKASKRLLITREKRLFLRPCRIQTVTAPSRLAQAQGTQRICRQKRNR
jgi:hypothetical protein